MAQSFRAARRDVTVRLVDHLAASGDRFFRLRSYLPLLLLPAFLASLGRPVFVLESDRVVLLWEFACLLVSLSGLVLRVVIVGTAPPGTSERSTRGPRASMLNTSGPYSVVRHPLYVGNSLIALGLSCVTCTWFLPVIVMLAALAYYERIAVREEAFLEECFGRQFLDWATQVPALVPKWRNYRPAVFPFKWRKTVRESHALLVIAAGFFVLDELQRYALTGRLAASRVWSAALVASSVVFVAVVVLKKYTRMFDTRENGAPIDSVAR